MGGHTLDLLEVASSLPKTRHFGTFNAHFLLLESVVDVGEHLNFISTMNGLLHQLGKVDLADFLGV